MTKQEILKYIQFRSSGLGQASNYTYKDFYNEMVEMQRNEVKKLSIPDVSVSLRSNAIEFAKWLQHLDNGTIHYNPFTGEKSESIGFSPNDCLISEHYTIEELYDKWRLISNNRQHDG